LCELPTQRVGRDEVDEGLLTVDLDDRDQLAIPHLQLGIPVDRDLLQLETELVARSDDRRAGLLAQMAPRGAVQPDQRRYG